jgi:hypothetical protein
MSMMLLGTAAFAPTLGHHAQCMAAPLAAATDDYGSPLHPAFMSEIFNF